MRRSKGGRRGLQRGVQRHKIAGRITEENDSDDEEAALSSSKLHISRNKLDQTLGKWCEHCFQAYSVVCYKLCLVALTKGSDGCIRPAKLWKRIIQAIIYTLIGSTVAYKMFVSVHRVVTTGTLDFATFLCFSAGLGQIVGVCVGSGAIFTPRVTMDVINSWVDMRWYLTNLRNGRLPPSSFTASMQVILTTIGTTFSIFALASFSLYFTYVPAFTIDMLRAAGLSFIDNSLPEWLWRVLFLPAEVFQYGAPLAPYAHSGHIMMQEVGLMKVYINELRRTPITTLERRKKVESMYVTFQLHNKLYNDWIRPVLFPMLLSLGCAVVICVYFPLKHHELPGFIILAFVSMAAFIMAVVFWHCFDEVTVIRNSEGVVGELQSRPTGSAWEPEFSAVQLERFLKRAKALRPFNIAVGTFGEFTLDVPAIMWEEILNQLVFLLSF